MPTVSRSSLSGFALAGVFGGLVPVDASVATDMIEMSPSMGAGAMVVGDVGEIVAVVLLRGMVGGRRLRFGGCPFLRSVKGGQGRRQFGNVRD